MSDYPRDLKDKDGNLREFKCKEDVPPGWFVRDTGEEVNPALAPTVISKKAMKAMAKDAADALAAEEPASE